MIADIRTVCDRIRNGFSLSTVADRAGVKLQRAGNEWKACCPFHSDRSPSFTIYANDRRFMCFGCGAQGDVLDFTQRAYRMSLVEAVQMLDAGALGAIHAPAAAHRSRKDLSELVARIWNEAQPIVGTPAATYLRRRGIDIDLPDCLRFARLVPPIKATGLRAANGPNALPALVALVTGSDGAITGLQRTYLNDRGGKAATVPTEQERKPKVKFSLGKVRTGAIRLGPVSASMLVTEGLEDGLTFAQALGRSVWVAAGTSMLPHIVFPDTVRAIVIGADGDDAGQIAATKAAEAYAARGLSVRIMYPSDGAKDANEALMARKRHTEQNQMARE